MPGRCRENLKKFDRHFLCWQGYSRERVGILQIMDTGS